MAQPRGGRDSPTGYDSIQLERKIGFIQSDFLIQTDFYYFYLILINLIFLLNFISFVVLTHKIK